MSKHHKHIEQLNSEIAASSLDPQHKTYAIDVLADAVMLDRMFQELAEWTGTGETWTLPWEVVP